MAGRRRYGFVPFAILTVLSLLYYLYRVYTPEPKTDLEHYEPALFFLDTAQLHAAYDSRVDTLERRLIAAGLVPAKMHNPQIATQLKYSTSDNFLGEDVYGGLSTAYVQPEVALMLDRAQQLLDAEKAGYRLLIYDAVRPRSVQWKMWGLVRGTGQQRYVAYPGNGSVHNYGAAVDLTIINEAGVPLDMGAGFDQFDALAEPQHESRLLAEGRLSEAQIANRNLLRRVMRGAGFRGLPNEWWHFDAWPRDSVKLKFSIVP